MQRSKFTVLSSFATVGLTVLALTGCGTSDSSPEPSTAGNETRSEKGPEDTGVSAETTTNPSGSGGEAVFSYGDTTYSAQLQFCTLSGDEDALFHGVAYDESGKEVGYLDGDFGSLSDIPYGETRINFGATDQFQSTDDFVAMGDAEAHLVVTDFSDTGLIIMGGAWDQDGTQLPTSTLRVNC